MISSIIKTKKLAKDLLSLQDCEKDQKRFFNHNNIKPRGSFSNTKHNSSGCTGEANELKEEKKEVS